MNINTLLPLLANICIYYYSAYYKEILHEHVNISNNIHYNIMGRIYERYVNIIGDEYIYDLKILNFPVEKIYILENEDIDIKDIIILIDEYIDNHRNYYMTDQLDVLSISNHPIENYISFDHNWIKSSLDILLF